MVKNGKKGQWVRLEMPGGEAKWSKEEVVACLDAKQGDVRVRGLVERGNNYVIEVHDRTDLEKLRQNERLEEKGVIVDGEKGWRMPRVRVLDVQNEIWKNDLLECVHRRNEISFDGMTMDKCKSEYVPEYITKKKDAFSDWVVRVSPRLFKRLCIGGRMYAGVNEYLGIRKSWKCHRFGHSGSRCDVIITCGWCGADGHHEVSCDKRDEQEGLQCVNCKRYGYKETAHSVHSGNCLIFEMQRAMLKRNTQYE